MSEACQQDHFPITAGGSLDERVTCTFFDPLTSFTVIAGYSSSNDFAAGASIDETQAFAYAVDYLGIW